MNFNNIHNVYFLGIGGIGMSALARYFLVQGKKVGGYDLTETPLTKSLVELGMEIHYVDNEDLISEPFKEKENTLIVFTPAIPNSNHELNYFRDKGFTLMKRAKVLGELFNANTGIAIAGTHGKTSVSTFTSFLMQESKVGCSAFLGGISKNYNSNLVLSDSDYVVAEADEFDRSFLQLYPHVLLVTTVDADHLDIYEDLEDITNTFNEFLNQVDKDGIIILNKKVNLNLPEGPKFRTYSLDDNRADYFASDLEIIDGAYRFTLNAPDGIYPDYSLEVPGKTNVENAIAALAVSFESGSDPEKLKQLLPQLRGVIRRFDLQYKSQTQVYIDDYAHHPRELDAVIGSVKELYPGKKITGIFQPHLYSRTRDFADDFADSLSQLDELLLLDIYPAREMPIAGITSDVIFDKVTIEKKQRCSKVNLLRNVKELNIEVLLTLGAGDIDQYVDLIKQALAFNEKG